MTTTLRKLREADDVYRRLLVALADADVLLPSLRVDLSSCADELIAPLLDLGRCNLPTAERLIAALTSDR
ncbi:hypothetical protein [Streptomyces xiaopingdaonensis]|uniref:hypothetical protein n=1 Tax=Streptomyces xiaopingdaonensis TaxID=1565415 RepID=UPI00030FD123|nr:hypothetical protein [Streptomyces xiaopingdaonensis]